MKIEAFVSQQPIAAKTLANALKNNTLSHCYLFVGDESVNLKEIATIIVQSMLCENKVDGFACQKCNSCKRIAENNYSDYIFIDGTNRNIKAEEILALQQQFDKTALESYGRKVFVINDCENLTAKAANSLLKFIEEPTNNITGIFLTHKVAGVLPTIVSRCQNVNFRGLNNDSLYEYCLSKDVRELTCHFLSKLTNQTKQIDDLLAEKNFDKAMLLFENFLPLLLDNDSYGIVFMQNQIGKIKKSSDKNLKTIISYFLDMCIIFCQDNLSHYNSIDQPYQDLINKSYGCDFDANEVLFIFSKCKDSLDNNVNSQLAIDKLLYLLYEVKL